MKIEEYEKIKWLLSKFNFLIPSYSFSSSSQSQYQVNSWFFWNVVVSKSSFIFKLLSSENKSLLVCWDTFLVSNFLFQWFDTFVGFDLDSHSSSSKSFDKNLHTAPQSQDQMNSWLFLNVVIGEASLVLELFASKNKPLLVDRDTFFLVDFGFKAFNWVSWLHTDSHSFSS